MSSSWCGPAVNSGSGTVLVHNEAPRTGIGGVNAGEQFRGPTLSSPPQACGNRSPSVRRGEALGGGIGPIHGLTSDPDRAGTPTTPRQTAAGSFGENCGPPALEFAASIFEFKPVRSSGPEELEFTGATLGCRSPLASDLHT